MIATQKYNQIKYCRVCNNELVMGINWTNGREKYRDYLCKSCINKKINNWNKANPLKIKKIRKKSDKKFKNNHPERQREINRKAHIKWRKTDKAKLITKKAIKKYRQSEKGKINMRKIQAKRNRNLGWFKLFDNPFDDLLKVEWHHITDSYVVAIPEDLHNLYKGYNYHRELVMGVAKQIYPNIEKLSGSHMW